MPALQETVDQVRSIDVDQYKYGFVTDIESEKAPKGLSEDTVRFISAKKNEPAWMLEWRLAAYRRWLTMTEPTWARVDYPKIDYQDLYYYSAPKKKGDGPKSLDEIDPEILATYAKLGMGVGLVAEMAVWALRWCCWQHASAACKQRALSQHRLRQLRMLALANPAHAA